MHKLYDFMEARERLSTITVKTKLLHSEVFSDECGNDVYIKAMELAARVPPTKARRPITGWWNIESAMPSSL